MTPKIKTGAWLVVGLTVIVSFAGLLKFQSHSVAAKADVSSRNENWVSLFDGKTLSGWEFLELRGKGTSQWKVKDGLLVGTGEPSMLYSPKGHYKNFRYRAEIKINDHGNSGMYIRAPKEATFSKGYEIQVNSTHGDPIKTGSIYTYVHVYKKIVPPDTWFTQEIEAVDKDFRGKVLPHIKVSINGETLYEFIDHTGFARQGHFAFQQHDPGSVVQIRKVEVMELP
ncbi:MAG: DUF1080 domain-containing protein [Isosphaeraceae bacterium]